MWLFSHKFEVGLGYILSLELWGHVWSWWVVMKFNSPHKYTGNWDLDHWWLKKCWRNSSQSESKSGSNISISGMNAFAIIKSNHKWFKLQTRVFLFVYVPTSLYNSFQKNSYFHCVKISLLKCMYQRVKLIMFYLHKSNKLFGEDSPPYLEDHPC